VSAVAGEYTEDTYRGRLLEIEAEAYRYAAAAGDRQVEELQARLVEAEDGKWKRAQMEQTIARLERERDEARRELEFYRTTEKGQVKAEADAARADAARMRLAATEARTVLRADTDDNGVPLTHRWRCLAGANLLEAALAPDDGWLSRKLAEAVEPYRVALRPYVVEWAIEYRSNGYGNCSGCGIGVDDVRLVPWAYQHDEPCALMRAVDVLVPDKDALTGTADDLTTIDDLSRALLGGTPTKEGE
jgi:hypothetical protein